MPLENTDRKLKKTVQHNYLKRTEYKKSQRSGLRGKVYIHTSIVPAITETIILLPYVLIGSTN